MQIKTISQLLKEGADLQKLLDFLMETESQSFVSELQEKRETYFNRINTFPEYVFLTELEYPDDLFIKFPFVS